MPTAGFYLHKGVAKYMGIVRIKPFKRPTRQNQKLEMAENMITYLTEHENN
jgi:hypothetical protein